MIPAYVSPGFFFVVYLYVMFHVVYSELCVIKTASCDVHVVTLLSLVNQRKCHIRNSCHCFCPLAAAYRSAPKESLNVVSRNTEPVIQNCPLSLAAG